MRHNNSIRSASIVVALTMCASVLKADENPVPTPLPADRYSAMSTHCPFAIATPAAPAATPQASFAANWFVSGLARIGDDYFVTIKARDLSAQFSIFGKESDSATGITLASVNWSDTLGKSTVVLRKGTETAQLEFNEAEIHATPAPQPRAKTSPQPGQTPMNTNANPIPVGHAPGPLVNPNGFPTTKLPPSPIGAPSTIRRRSVPIPVPNQPRPN